MFPTTAKIRRHIRNFIQDKPFSIRDFLNYGSRSAVDQAFHRLVLSGEIVRVARGVYLKEKAPYPSVLEVAMVKAASFKKIIATHGSAAAHALKLVGQASTKHVFASSGHTSSFRFGRITIRFIGSCARKMRLGNAPVGLAIRALWYLGKNCCDPDMASQACRSFLRSDNQTLGKSFDLMPGWMRPCFEPASA